MVASYLPTSLVAFSWLKCSPPDDREAYVLPVRNGEPCFAILLYNPPKRSKWRPRTVDAIPPMHLGKQTIFFPSRVLGVILHDVAEFNASTLLRLKPGKRIRCWAVAVEMVCGFDETARVVIGGGA